MHAAATLANIAIQKVAPFPGAWPTASEPFRTGAPAGRFDGTAGAAAAAFGTPIAFSTSTNPAGPRYQPPCVKPPSDGCPDRVYVIGPPAANGYRSWRTVSGPVIPPGTRNAI